MSVKSSVFGAVHLTGHDAKKFKQQVKYGRPKQAAKTALANGKALLGNKDSHGHVVIERVRKVA